ncbi:fimbria/pilus periplasmic chaperone [Pseudoalteromonas sp. SMS1]|uniref:fimbrial biogenesis chaperone n=1 Tax=Pseudoalteromonas sp. SMS1 TaxID=2908894 RepID=UPI001F414207|nr:fimbria/pilus periplasmic chaperone [Pseudoalteromonas sp. SMS1]MCF2856507.1 fimbria/pilus periplasmic chaperone [Pseudoalteromonas sp. SMS1]
MKKIFVFTGLLVAGLLSNLVQASLMISPTRVVFDERQRTAKVFLINNSQEEKTYRLGWKEKQALAAGGYRDLAADEVGPWQLSHMVRMTPKQVHLGPGERQVVKLALRRKKDMTHGEYRSHLFFQALPTEQHRVSQAIGINLNMILSYSIPIMYRKQTSIPTVTIGGAHLKLNSAGQQVIHVDISRQGYASAFGKIQAYWKAHNSEQWHRVSVANNFAIYPEVAKANIELNILSGKKIAGRGQLKVTYDGQEEYAGKTLAQRIFALTLSQ